MHKDDCLSKFCENCMSRLSTIYYYASVFMLLLHIDFRVLSQERNWPASSNI